MPKKVVISQGHGGADAGSIGADGKSEKTRIRNLAPLVEERIEKAGYKVTLKNEKNASGRWAFSFASGDFKFSLHFNSFNKKATGTECLYKKKSMRANAAKMSRMVAKAIGIKDRGAKYRSDLYMMNIGFDLLLEVCFHDNKKDLEAYKRNMTKVADAIAEVIIDILGGVPSSGESAAPGSPSSSTGELKVDGSWGNDTTEKSQKVFKTPQDGVVANQPYSNKKYLINVYAGSWEFKKTGYARGSELIKAIQKFLKERDLYYGDTDGWCGRQTVIAMQKFLRGKGYYDDSVDGSMGPNTVKGWQKYINIRL